MSETERKILETAKKEFLERGFRGTSMRRIAALAGVTTGALYGYFDSKEKIFDSLVKDSYDAVMAAYKGAHEEFAAKFAGRYFSTPKKMGAQTAEANINAGIAAAKQIEDYLKNGVEKFRVNK